jgi:peptidoglycan-associated lipoprotein
MMSAGVSSSQIRTISYGEERPVVQGADGQSMAQNRRVELKY